MKRNMGRLDRAIRVVVVAPAAVMAAIRLGPTSGPGIALWAIAGVMPLTASLGLCLLYVPFGIDTRRNAWRTAAHQAASNRGESLEPGEDYAQAAANPARHTPREPATHLGAKRPGDACRDGVLR